MNLWEFWKFSIIWEEFHIEIFLKRYKNCCSGDRCSKWACCSYLFVFYFQNSENQMQWYSFPNRPCLEIHAKSCIMDYHSHHWYQLVILYDNATDVSNKYLLWQIDHLVRIKDRCLSENIYNKHSESIVSNTRPLPVCIILWNYSCRSISFTLTPICMMHLFNKSQM